jgi:hypothetical protein
MPNNHSKPHGLALRARDIAVCREAGRSGQHSLLELDCRIWKNDLDLRDGPDLLKEPRELVLSFERRN